MTIESYVQKHGERFVREEFLFPWLAMPSVSNKGSEDFIGLENAAEFLLEEFKSQEFDRAEYIDLPGGANKVIYAEKFVSEKLPTVLIYGHYDVQPVGDLSAWNTKPFTPEIIGERIYARGASDDKGQIVPIVLAMRYFKHEDNFPCNVKFIIEGNEESGLSPNPFHAFVGDNDKLLKSDLTLVLDTDTIEAGHPAVAKSLKGVAKAKVTTSNPMDLIKIIHGLHKPVNNRISEEVMPDFYNKIADGLVVNPSIEAMFGGETQNMGFIKPEVGFTQLHHRWFRPTFTPLSFNYANKNPGVDGTSYQILINGPDIELHSGGFGGPIQEPGLVLTHILAGLDEKGIKFDLDFYQYGLRESDSTKIYPKSRAQISVDDNIDLKSIINELVYDYAFGSEYVKIKKLNATPRNAYLNSKTMTFGDGSPTSYLSFRLVPNQDSKSVLKQLETHVQAHNGTMIEPEGYEPYISDVENKYAQALIRGIRKGYDIGPDSTEGKRDVDIIGVGGSIPISHKFTDTLKTPVVFLGLAPPDGNGHGPNENMLVSDIYNGASSVVYGLEEIAKEI
ncbi:MAG: M20/M25/M40 family metallo-hydrolase [Nanoarchaeota archaeon]|nr:M20/M25/M40 family metallo-hydrolase [Nanoarchaeota archaeon]